MDNSKRKKSLLYVTKEAVKKLNIKGISFPIKYVSRSQIDKVVSKNSSHQGVALKVKLLEKVTLDKFLMYVRTYKSIVIILDQITDPQNIGAIIRSAKAFGATAIICLEKNTPRENTLMAKSSAGALESIQIIHVKNLVNTIKKLKEYNFWSIAMDNNSDLTLKELSKNSSLFSENLAIILGSEGKGIRPLVKNNCDISVRIDISSNINSLNVSATLAIVLYEINRT